MVMTSTTWSRQGEETREDKDHMDIQTCEWWRERILMVLKFFIQSFLRAVALLSLISISYSSIEL